MNIRRTLAGLTGLALALGTLVLTAPAASAHGDRQRIEQLQRENADAAGPAASLLMSDNVQHVANVPGQAGISGCFMKTAPVFVTSGLDSIKVFDVSDPLNPTVTGTMPSGQFENEAMNCGERYTRNGVKRFVLIGVDLFQASPDELDHVNAGDGNELIVVDVTDPTDPTILSRVPGTTSTHTVTCVQATDCRFAYSAGGRNDFSIFDLNHLGKPKEVDANKKKSGVQPFASPTGGHKWNVDNAGYATHTGYNGAAIFDTTRPRHPKLVTTTGEAGKGTDPKHAGWNDFILHNSFRPNAKAFKPGAKPSFANGNILLATEEDYEQTDCTIAGSFQTWWVKRLDGKDKSAIVPLDKVELSDLGNYPLPVGAFCSAHWFSYHPSGVVTVGFYGGGTQLVDVRNPRKLSSYGYALTPGSQVWDSYWVPKYDADGLATSRVTNIAYSVDLVRGLDVYSVDLPGKNAAAEAVPLGARTSFGQLSWPREGLPVSLVLVALVGAAWLRRLTSLRALRRHTTLGA